MREKFEDRKLTGNINVACKYDDGTIRYWEVDKQTTVARIVAIVKEFRRLGYKLTLRQLHYQLVTRNWIVNHDTAYKKLGSILDDCRYAGVVDWDDIEDRGRVPYIPYSVDDAKEAVEDAAAFFRINRQENQQNIVELWSEKDALSGILKRSTEKYHIQLVVNKGYGSSSSTYAAYNRVANAIKSGKRFTILYFGDHDPSGLDMVRDIRERITFMLCNGEAMGYRCDVIDKWWDENQYNIHTLMEGEWLTDKWYKDFNDGHELSNEHENQFTAARIGLYLQETNAFQVIQIGLTKDQVDEYKLPPNPTKLTDTRAKAYIAKFGRTCWEVDALSPQLLTEIVEVNIEANIDLDIFEGALEREKEEKEKIQSFKDQI